VASHVDRAEEAAVSAGPGVTETTESTGGGFADRSHARANDNASRTTSGDEFGICFERRVIGDPHSGNRSSAS
jgi:hypothetical protein